MADMLGTVYTRGRGLLRGWWWPINQKLDFCQMAAPVPQIMDTSIITITILEIIHSPVLFKTQVNSIDLSVPHSKHITSALRAQQVNAIYRFVTMVY
jgi:hypothetical protein